MPDALPAFVSKSDVEMGEAINNYNSISENIEDDIDEDHCTICLQEYIDRTIIPDCVHEFCFECIMMWTEQSRRCPLCSQTIGPYLMHNIRSKFDYQKHHLPPLRSSPPPLEPLQSQARQSQTRRIRERQWGRRARRAKEEADELEKAIDKRRWVYQNNLYAKHVASNQYTRFRPYPTPAQFSASPDFISRATAFIRRELQVWVNLDVEFLTTFIISLMKAIDIRTESAVKLLAEFLDMDTPYVEGIRHVNAEHFAHGAPITELYCYMRSPYKSLSAYDAVVQYDNLYDNTRPSRREHSNRWHSLEHQSERRSGNIGHYQSMINDDSGSDQLEKLSSEVTGRRRRDSKDLRGNQQINTLLSEGRIIRRQHQKANDRQRETDVSGSSRQRWSRDVSDDEVFIRLVEKDAGRSLPTSPLDRGEVLESHLATTKIQSSEQDLSKLEVVHNRGSDSHDQKYQTSGKEPIKGPVKIIRHRGALSHVQAYLSKAAEQRISKNITVQEKDNINLAGDGLTQMEISLAADASVQRKNAKIKINNLTCETKLNNLPETSFSSKVSESTVLDGDSRQDTNLSSGLDNEHTGARMDYTVTFHSNGSAGDETTGFPTNVPPLSSTRAKLLQKLDEEKSKVTNHSVDQDNNQTSDKEVNNRSVDLRTRFDDATTIAEARLRTKARVRMKLVAEKRSAVQI